MYIEPNTNIRILNNVPLNNTYEHTIYFANETSQRNYFIGKTKHSLTRQSYQRKEREYIVVAVPYESLIDCNYVMFQNAAFGSKWFYAFITSLEYNNNNSTVIHFEIDVIQTWLFETTLKQCFVEREHSATDDYFDHVIDENLDYGDKYVCHSTMRISYNDMAICILASEAPVFKFDDTVDPSDLNGATGTYDNFYSSAPCYQNNVYTPIGIYPIPINRITSVADQRAYSMAFNYYIYEGKTDAIIAIYQIPAELVELNPDYSMARTSQPASSFSVNNSIFSKYRIKQNPDVRSFTISPNKSDLEGYIPKNKKLFNAPYNVLQVSNKSGDSATYNWEDFELTQGGNAEFETCASGGTIPEVMCRPINYLGYNDNPDLGIMYENFPVCGWISDAFRAWWAQNRGSISTSLVSAAMSTALGIASGLATTAGTGGAGAAIGGIQIASSVSNGLGAVLGVIGTAIDKAQIPNGVHGQAQMKSLNAGMEWIGFDLNSLTIDHEYAEMLDNFFDRYGYVCKLNKIPNRNVRPHWCYCKTVGCTAVGGVPSDDLSEICAIYDKGITWWKNGDEVGNYALDNRV